MSTPQLTPQQLVQLDQLQAAARDELDRVLDDLAVLTAGRGDHEANALIGAYLARLPYPQQFAATVNGLQRLMKIRAQGRAL